MPANPTTPIAHIWLDDCGVAWIDDTHTKMNELWEEEVVRSEDRPDPAIVKLLEERWRHYEQHPESAVSLEEFRRRIGEERE